MTKQGSTCIILEKIFKIGRDLYGKSKEKALNHKAEHAPFAMEVIKPKVGVVSPV